MRILLAGTAVQLHTYLAGPIPGCVSARTGPGEKSKSNMKLLVQPDDGIRPLIKAIAGARRSIEIVIFRFDQREVERTLGAAVARGVDVRALIAHTNRAGEEGL